MTRKQLMDKAFSYLAIREVGTTNDNQFGREFGLNFAPWCAIFISMIFWYFGKGLKGGGWTKGYASVPLMLQNFKDHYTDNPQFGDIVIYDWDHAKGPDHVELFICWLDRAAGAMLCVGGNTGPHDPSNGGEVMISPRHIESVVKFIDITPLL